MFSIRDIRNNEDTVPVVQELTADYIPGFTWIQMIYDGDHGNMLPGARLTNATNTPVRLYPDYIYNLMVEK